MAWWRRRRLVKLAEGIIRHNAFQAAAKRLDQGQADVGAYMDAVYAVVPELVNQHGATFDEAIEAFWSSWFEGRSDLSKKDVLEHLRSVFANAAASNRTELLQIMQESRTREAIRAKASSEAAAQKLADHNRDCKQLFDRIMQAQHRCPHCGITSRNYRFSDGGETRKSLIICRACGWPIPIDE